MIQDKELLEKYQKELAISSLAPFTGKEVFSDQEIYTICKHTYPELLSNSTIQKLSAFRSLPEQDTCLHIAAEYGNHLLINELIKKHPELCNLKNSQRDNPLMHALRHNSGRKLTKTVKTLISYTNLKQEDKDGRVCYEIESNHASNVLEREELRKILQIESLKQTEI